MVAEFMRVSKVIRKIEVPLYVNFMFWLYPLEQQKDKELKHLVKHGIGANHWSPREVGL